MTDAQSGACVDVNGKTDQRAVMHYVNARQCTMLKQEDKEKCILKISTDHRM